MDSQSFYAITEKSQVGEARRRLVEMVEKGGFDSTATEKVAIIVTELATNLLKHAGEGELVARILELNHGLGIEILALDRGPGMANVAACLRDGYSTTGSLGQGLGAIRRLSTNFELYSAPGVGTALLVQLSVPPSVSASADRAVEHPFVYSAICRPKRSEEVSGDGWRVHCQANRCTILVCDGLGHGPEAAVAAQQAIRTFSAQPERPATAQLEAIHMALRGTRGAAIAHVEIIASETMHASTVHFIGVGNISGRVFAEDSVRHLLSQNGIVGHQMRKIQGFPAQWAKEALLILSSDGLGTRWTLDSYPGLRHRHPSLIAGVLYRDFTRGTDDVTVLVVKML